MAAVQYVYVLQKLSKTYPGGKQVLKDISLSFLPGAKIGVVGLNGAGKSTLLRIMAGDEKDFSGEAWAADGIRVGYLSQEPQLDAAKDVLGNAMDGVAEKKAMLDRYNELAMNYSEETADEMAQLQDVIDGQNPVAWLERYLKDYPGCVILVTHDRYFLDNLTEWTLELDRGQGVPYKGNYSSWLEQKAKRLEQEGREEEAKQRTLARELDWIRASPKARQAKSKARIKAFEELAEEAGREQVGRAQISIPTGQRLGGNVLDVEGVSKGFGDVLLIDDLSFKLPPGGIVGVIGANGAGKTTLFRMIVGQEQPDKGVINLGETVQLGYVDQSRDALDAKKSVWEEISDGNDVITLGKREVSSRAYCGWFNFKGPDQQKKVGQLSGGERNRVHLAKMLREGGNLLLLDEPTNDLDVETLSSLEAALEDFPGCAIVISHDRFFLDRIATHILAFEGDSHVEWFEGNFESYEEDKRRRLGDAAVEPHRVTFRQFER
ncbi:MAG: energy-dependent translational throttle protein EttA [Alphaproteobacteria bacterium]